MDDVAIHGFVSQGYLQSSDYNFYSAETEDGSYEFNEFGINFSSTVTDDLRIGMQLLSRDLGEIGNNKVDIDWAFADYAFRNWLGLRVGRVKKPDGLFNQYRDIDATRTCIFLPPGNYREDARDASLAVNGAGIYGTLPGGLEYQATYGVFAVPKDGGVARRLETLMGSEVTDTKVEPSYNAWLNWRTPVSGLSVGMSATDFDFSLDADIVKTLPLSTFTGDPSHAATNLETRTPTLIKTDGAEYRLFSQYTFDNLMLAAEYLWGKHNINTTVAGTSVQSRQEPESWYVMATYRFCDWFEMGTYYCKDINDTNDRDGDSYVARGEPKEKAWLKDWALSARFDINSFWLFKLEAHFMDGLKDVDYGNDVDPSARWQLYAAKLTYVF
jgi:hypothetical protein